MCALRAEASEAHEYTHVHQGNSGFEAMQYFERLLSHPSLDRARARAAAYTRLYRLDRAIRAAREASAGPIPNRVVAAICEGWGDPALPAADGHLASLLVEAQKSHGYVLQCGADLTTLLLAIQIERRGVRLWVFESSPHAADPLRSWLAQYELTHVHVIAAPADLDASGVGYAFDAARLPSPLSLVVCDAQGIHPGNVRRILPRLEGRIHPNGVILVRNMRRRADLEFLTGWCRGHGASFVVKGKADPFAKIVLRDDARREDDDAARINTAFARQTKVKSLRLATPAKPRKAGDRA